MECALGDIQVPDILSVEEVLEDVHQEIKTLASKPNPCKVYSELSEKDGFEQAIEFGHANYTFTGIAKMAIKKGCQTSLDKLLKTNVLIMKHQNKKENVTFSVYDIIKEIRHNETGHFDTSWRQHPQKKFFTLSRMSDRHILLLGIAEYVIATYRLLTDCAEGWYVNEYPNKRKSGILCVHIGHYEENPKGVLLPTILLMKNGQPHFNPNVFLFRELEKGENFVIFPALGKMRFFVNDEHKVILSDDGEEHVLGKVPHLPFKNSKDFLFITALPATIKLLLTWKRWKSVVAMMEQAKKVPGTQAAAVVNELMPLKLKALRELEGNN